MESITVYSPGTVANLSVGLDVLGLCLKGVEEKIVIRKTQQAGVSISKIYHAKLPKEPQLNVAGLAAMSLLNALPKKLNFGIDLELHKTIKPGSGLGSSAASAVGTVCGVNELLGNPFTKAELLPFAMEGEFLASKAWHADNLAPALFGGITFILENNNFEVINLPVPQDLAVAVIHPQIEIKTSESRNLLPKAISLKDLKMQQSYLGGFLQGLHTQNFELIGKSINDVVAEPYRKKSIPHFEAVKKTALHHGALGVGISGSGPSIFALCKGNNVASKVAKAMEIKMDSKNIINNTYYGKINHQGVRIEKN